MTEHNELTEQDPDRKPREELEQDAMAAPGEEGYSLGAPQADSTDDGVPVGTADVEADRERSGA